ERGEFPFREELEDIHLNIEARLQEKIGEGAGRLHTARSRNDQIATDMRLFVMEACDDAVLGIRGMQAALLDLAEANQGAVMPGYTHLQRAQPVLFAHHLLAYFEMLDRDSGRFRDCRSRADDLRLGAAALAGSPYPLRRALVACRRGPTCRVYVQLQAILTTLKGLPLAYNRDLQEDKQPLFDSVDTVLPTLETFAALLPALQVDGERMEAAARNSYTLATDLADYLVHKGMPFREAHQTVAELVRYAEGDGKPLSGLSLEEYRGFSPLFDQDVLTLDVRASIAARDVPGGTAPSRVAA